MTGVGKVDKKVLKAGFWAGRDRMVRIAVCAGCVQPSN